MNLASQSRAFRLEKSSNEKGVLREFQYPHFAGIISARELESAVQPRFIGAIQSKIAMVSFRDFSAPVNLTDSRTFFENNSSFLLDEWTGKAGDQCQTSVRVGLRVVCFVPLEDVPSIFDEGMLKASASAKKGNSPRSGKMDRLDSAIHTGVRAGGNAPEAVKGR